MYPNWTKLLFIHGIEDDKLLRTSIWREREILLQSFLRGLLGLETRIEILLSVKKTVATNLPLVITEKEIPLTNRDRVKIQKMIYRIMTVASLGIDAIHRVLHETTLLANLILHVTDLLTLIREEETAEEEEVVGVETVEEVEATETDFNTSTNGFRMSLLGLHTAP
ncbi:hypothetical protein K438DRAFT_1959828 [Mycena galopus ATCC 62051]|nr:hypothetical protein K438DRAFT_1959828 [Mycena galopus ATCC 62051]